MEINDEKIHIERENTIIIFSKFFIVFFVFLIIANILK